MALKANALTTLAVAKSHLDIAPSDTAHDARLERFINASSQRIETFTDRKLVDQGAITEFQDGRRENIIILREFPILTVTEVNVDGDRVFGSPTALATTDYGIGDARNSIYNFRNIFPSGYQNIKITYTAGFASASIPSDLELACLWFVEWFYLHRGRQDMGRTTASKQDESVGVLSEAPKMIMEILQDYKRMDFALSNSPVRNY